MIWLWAAISIGLSFLIAKFKKVSFPHFIWLFLPIDFYGIQIGNFLLKPYVLLFIALIIYTFIKKRKFLFEKDNNILFVFFFVFLICDIGSGLVANSIRQHVLFILFLCFSFVYSSYCKEKKEKEDVLNSIISASIGYGVINVVAAIFYLMNIKVPGLYGESNCIIKTYISMDIASSRMCGFEGDPNAFCIFYVIALAISSYLLFSNKKNSIFNVCGLLLSFSSIIFSKSRAALLLSLLVVLAVIILKIKSIVIKRRYGLITSISLSLIGLIVFCLVKKIDVTSLFVEVTNSQNRAGLFDSFGRVSIWVENFKNMLILNPLFGIGSNQSYLYSSVGRACHNTWIEFCCSLGLVFGPIVVAIFLYPLFKKLYQRENVTLKVGLICSYLLLLTIDYIANIYILIILCILLKTKEQRKLWKMSI